LTITDKQGRKEIFDQYPGCDSRVFDYVEGVLSGEIDACEAIQLACKRTMQDLADGLDPDCRWTFDVEKACKPIRFTEKFMRPSGDYDRMELQPWQCWVYASLYGFVDRHDRRRKYLYLLFLVGSGNGKTPMVASMALYQVSQEGVRNAEFDILANSKDQAGTLLTDCRSMVENNPALKKKFKPLQNRVEYFADGVKGQSRSAVPDAVIRTLSSNARSLDGLRPTTAAFDEAHEMKTYDQIRQMRRSLDKKAATGEPLLIIFSTMGYVLDGPLIGEYRSAKQMLKGNGNKAVNERRLAIIYELDEHLSPDDWQHWGQANPSLGVLLSLERMRLRYAEAQLAPDLLLDFYTKTLNLFTKVSSLSYLDYELIQRNQDVVDMESVLGREAFGGFDISTSYDHTGVALEIPLDDGRFLFLFHCFVPRRVADMNRENLDYYAHAMKGELTIIDGDYVHQSYVLAWFEKWAKVFDIRAIGYDPANATLLVQSLSSWRGEDKPVFVCDPVRQGALTLNAPMKHLKEQFSDGKIVYNRSTLFEWYLNNVKLRKDFATRDNENWVPVKLDKFSKIDVFMAALDAHATWMRRCPPPGAEVQESSVAVYDLEDLPGYLANSDYMNETPADGGDLWNWGD